MASKPKSQSKLNSTSSQRLGRRSRTNYSFPDESIVALTFINPYLYDTIDMIRGKCMLTCASCYKRLSVTSMTAHWKEEHSIRQCHGCNQLVDSYHRLTQKGECSHLPTHCRFCHKLLTHGELREHQRECPYFEDIAKVVRKKEVQPFALPVRHHRVKSVTSIASMRQDSPAFDYRQDSNDLLNFDSASAELDELWMGRMNNDERGGSGRMKNVRSGSKDRLFSAYSGLASLGQTHERRLREMNADMTRHFQRRRREKSESMFSRRPRYDGVTEPRLSGSRPSVLENTSSNLLSDILGEGGSRSMVSLADNDEAQAPEIPEHLINRMKYGPETTIKPVIEQESIFQQTYKKVASGSKKSLNNEAPSTETFNLFYVHAKTDKKPPIKPRNPKPKLEQRPGEAMNSLFSTQGRSSEFGLGSKARGRLD